MLPNGSEATILLVDDEPRIGDALGRHLSNERYHILRAASAAEARQVMAHQHVDVVVSDERMPGESGSELFASVRRQYPNTIRIILTGHASLEAAVRAINEGEVYRFFLKPCDPTDLIFTIRRALEQKRLEQGTRELLSEFRRQTILIETLEQDRPGLLRLELDESGAIVVEEEDSCHSVDDLLREIEVSMALHRNRLNRA
jgi:two-component system, probable response regulator PhcQ